MDAITRRKYEVALKEAEAELGNHEKRIEMLRGVIEGLKGLLKEAEAPKKRHPVKQKTKSVRKRRRKSAGAGHPKVSPRAYRGMGPTDAYRKFLAQYGDTYTVPQIRDALLRGGVKSTSSTALLTGIHSVIRRDRLKAETEAARKAEAANKAEAEAEAANKEAPASDEFSD